MINKVQQIYIDDYVDILKNGAEEKVMIQKVPGFTNKYKIVNVTNSELENWLKPIIDAGAFKGFILNKNTAARVGVRPGQKFVTINNKVEDGYLYLNVMR